jgi:hypothetical protein
MSSDYINNPKHWQARAAEMRAIAGTMAEGGIKASMLRLAGLAGIEDRLGNLWFNSIANLPAQYCSMRLGGYSFSSATTFRA